MNKLSTTNVLLLVCLVSLPLCMAQFPYKPVAKFDYNKVAETVWYQILWADTAIWEPTFCCIFWYQRMCPTDSTNYWHLNSYNSNSAQSDPKVGGINGKINPKAQGELRISYWQDNFDADYILEYAEDYSWLIRADTYSDATGFIDVVTKTPDGNAYAVARALELAKQYNLTQVHYLTQSKDCDYKGALNKIKDITAL